jgi:Protein of unknown function (DUF4229)
VKAFVVYSVARLGIFVASYAIIAGIWLLATGGEAVPLLWPLLVAMVISAVASVYLLRGPRQRFAAQVDERATRAARKFEEMRAKEDSED